MFQLLLLAFAVYNLWQVTTRLPQMREFSVPTSLRLFWIGSVAGAVFGLFAASIPRATVAFPIYPLPLGILYFVPPILVGRLACNSLRKHGTSRTEELEKTASNTAWMGIFSIGFTVVIWCITLASVSVSSDKFSR